MIIGFVLLILFLFLASKYRPPWRSGTAHGTSRWASEENLRKAGFFEGKGLILGRTTRRLKLLHTRSYCHTMVCAPTGAGKGVSLVIPTLFEYNRGSTFIFDPKGELYRITAKVRKKMGQKIFVIDPFNVVTKPGESDCFNPLLAILPGPTLIDEARAAAESLVVRPAEGDRDPFWNNSACVLITTMLIATLLFMKKDQRNFDTVREMMTDPVIFAEVLARLQRVGGIPGRMANQIIRQAQSEKEFAGVCSTANTHVSFCDSELVAAIINESSFSANVLLEPGSTIYCILPVEQLEAQRGYLRLIVSTFLRHIMRHGVKHGGECLFLLDECSSLSGLDALAQAFALGRGSGIRLYTFWQTAEQAQAAFKKTPNLVSDNSDTQIYFGVNSYPTADLISKMLGSWTMVTSSANDGKSGNRSNSLGQQGSSYSTSWSEGRTHSEIARPLLHPAEIIQLSRDYLIAFVKGVNPILARRIKYYSDPAFRRRGCLSLPLQLLWWLLLAAVIALIAWGA